MIVYGYDAEGNLVFQFIDEDESGDFTTGDTGVTEYLWDHRNRLVSVTNFDDYADWYAETSAQTVEYAYDFLNRLVGRTVDADGAGTAESAAGEYFVYDAGQIVLQLDAAGAATHRYLWAPAVDLLLADETVDNGGAEDVRWALADHENTVRDILALNDAGTPGNPADDYWAVANHLTYEAFGRVASETNAAAADCLFAFTGRLHDSATDLQNNTARWYNTQTGRWQSEDPIGFLSADTNLYRYCGNDPVNWIDPGGLAEQGGQEVGPTLGEVDPVV